jgi:SAM-dependent methyltransferase
MSIATKNETASTCSPHASPGLSTASRRSAQKRVFQDTQSERDDGGTFAQTLGASSKEDNAIAAHYDKRARESTAERRRCRVLPLRNANNSAKARLIEDAVGRAARRIASSEDTSRPLYVLDFGCGKGGDLLKYAHASQAHNIDIVYYGVDLSHDSIAEARRRSEQTKSKHSGRLIQIEFAQGDFCSVGNAALPVEWLTADIVSVQFAIHYAFASTSAVRRFFDNVGRALASDGEMIGTLVDCACLQALVSGDAGQQLDATEHCQQQQSTNNDNNDLIAVGNSLYSISCSRATKAALLCGGGGGDLSATSERVGLRYQFALDGCIEDCDEFVVDRDYLRAMAAVIGLDLKIWLPVRCLYNARDTLAIDADVEQRQVSDLYAAFVFARTVKQ